MKVLFLDIDGVLIPENKNDYDFDSPLVTNLKEIIKQTGVKIIISSDRRYDEELLNGVFQKHGLEYFDTTKLDDNNFNDYTNKGLALQRKKEILYYLSDNNKNISTYVIVDDLDLGLDGNMTHFFKTEKNIGLTVQISKEIIDFLNSK